MLYYELDNTTKTATITGLYNSFFDINRLIIPSIVSYKGNEYSVTTIGERAFSGCSSLTEIDIPNSVTTIGDRAFYNCNSLTEITIPNSVTAIGDEAFSYCSSLTEITIPNSVTAIGKNAFSYCRSLTEITIPNSVTAIGDEAFSYCSSLKEVTIPNSVTAIGDWTFSYCRSLTEVNIPNSVTTIGDKAFYSCYSLTEVIIGGNVESIGDYAFSDCPSLTSVTSLNPTPPTISYHTFESGTERNAILYVPEGCKEVYEASPNWRNFLNIQSIISADINTTLTGRPSENNVIYTIDGVRCNETSISNLPGGIYIVDGKKRMVK